MKIDKVTITGADDTTDIDWLFEMSKKYPFVEWGILTSRSQEGLYRFPSREWMRRLTERIKEPINLSLHVCGAMVRAICRNEWQMFDHYHGSIDIDTHFRRVQLNFHSYLHQIEPTFYTGLLWVSSRNNWQFIMQLDDVNNDVFSHARERGVDAVPLFDLSGGAGVLPASWPAQTPGIYSGYAGGLGPHTLAQELPKIEKVANPDGLIWIDMEKRVRTDDDAALDTERVEAVLEQMVSSPFLVTNQVQNA